MLFDQVIAMLEEKWMQMDGCKLYSPILKIGLRIECNYMIQLQDYF